MSAQENHDDNLVPWDEQAHVTNDRPIPGGFTTGRPNVVTLAETPLARAIAEAHAAMDREEEVDPDTAAAQVKRIEANEAESRRRAEFDEELRQQASRELDRQIAEHDAAVAARNVQQTAR